MSAVYDLSVELCKILQNDYNNRGSEIVRYSFEITEGRKYYKIVQRDVNFSGGSVHRTHRCQNGIQLRPAGRPE